MVSSLNPDHVLENLGNQTYLIDKLLKRILFSLNHMRRWYDEIHIVFGTQNLYGAIYDLPPEVPSFSSSFDEHEKYGELMRLNHLARQCMLSTMHGDIKERYMVIETTYEMWALIKSDAMAHAQFLKYEVNSIYSKTIL